MKESNSEVHLDVNVLNWTNEVVEKFLDTICMSKNITKLHIKSESYRDKFHQLVLSHWVDVRVKDVNIRNISKSAEDPLAFWKSMSDAMEKNYEIMKFGNGDNMRFEQGEDENAMMLRFYCLLNRCGRGLLLKNSSSTDLALLPLALARVNYELISKEGLYDRRMYFTDFCKTRAIYEDYNYYNKGLHVEDALFYFVKYGLVPMISESSW